MSKQVCYIRDCESDGCGGGDATRPSENMCQHRGGGNYNRNRLSHNIDLHDTTFAKNAEQWVNSEWGNGGMADGHHTGAGDKGCAVEECKFAWITHKKKAHKSTYCEHKHYTETNENCCLGYVAPEDDPDFPLLGENYVTYDDMTIASLFSEKDPHLAVWINAPKVNILFKRTAIPHIYTLQYMDRFAYPSEIGAKQSNMLDTQLNNFYLSFNCRLMKVYWSPEPDANSIQWKVTKDRGKYLLEHTQNGRVTCPKSVLAVGALRNYNTMRNTLCNARQLNGTYYIVAGSKQNSPGEIADRNCGNSSDPESLSGTYGQAGANADLNKYYPGDNNYRGGNGFQIKPKDDGYAISMATVFLCPESSSSNNVKWLTNEHKWYIEPHPKSESDSEYADWYSIRSSRNNARKYLSVTNDCDEYDDRYPNVDLWSAKRWWKILPHPNQEKGTSECRRLCDQNSSCTAYESNEKTTGVCSLFSNTGTNMRRLSVDPATKQEGRTCNVKKSVWEAEVLGKLGATGKFQFTIERVPPDEHLQWVQWRHHSSEHPNRTWKDPHAFFMNENTPSKVGNDDMKMSVYLRNLKDPLKYRKLYPQNHHRHYNSLRHYNREDTKYSETESTKYDPCHEKFVTHKTCDPEYHRGSPNCKGFIYPDKCKKLEYAIERGLPDAWKNENAQHGGCQSWFDSALKKDSNAGDYKRAVEAANAVCVLNDKAYLPDLHLERNCAKWSQRYPADFVPYVASRCTTGTERKMKDGMLTWNANENSNNDDKVCGNFVKGEVTASIREISNEDKRRKALDLTDSLVISYCNDIRNRKDPRCACFMHPKSNLQWQREEGKIYYKDLGDKEISLDAACVVPECRAADHSFRTQDTQQIIETKCPNCIQSINNKVWNSEWRNVKQLNICGTDQNGLGDGNAIRSPTVTTKTNTLCSKHEKNKGSACCNCADAVQYRDPSKTEKDAIKECSEADRCTDDQVDENGKIVRELVDGTIVVLAPWQMKLHSLVPSVGFDSISESKAWLYVIAAGVAAIVFVCAWIYFFFG